MRAKHGKPNKLALRVLSTAAFMTMVTSIAAPAFADAYGIATYGTYYVDQGSVTVEAGEAGAHYVTQITGTDKDGNIIYGKDDKGNTLNRYLDKDKEGVTITNKDTSKSTDNTVSLKDASVTIKDLDIDASETGKAAISTSGKTTIELEGNNKLTGGEGHAALEKWSNALNRDTPDPNHTLTIKDDDRDGDKAGSLTATGGAGGVRVLVARSTLPVVILTTSPSPAAPLRPTAARALQVLAAAKAIRAPSTIKMVPVMVSTS